MESMNYTYEYRNNLVKRNELYGGTQAVSYSAWAILNPKGRKIAEATSEKQAALIVSALNGVAV